MAKQAAFIPVSERALVQRINRKLRPDDKQLKKCRSSRWVHELGEYYVLNLRHNFITSKQVDVETLGRELGVLSAWERIAN